MLEKSEKKFEKFCDAHFHQYNCEEYEDLYYPDNWYGCSCALFSDEWEYLNNHKKKNCIYSFGVHPQFAAQKNIEQITYNLDYLENLCKNNETNIKLSAIGEIGFDFFTEEYKSEKETQEFVFKTQIELAIKYNLPVVIHCRKANEKIFENITYLKKIPGVLFHSFMGTFDEANSIMKKGVNAYFSFGKQILNNNKKAIQCVSNIPLNNLLLETDAPYQHLKGEDKTSIDDITKVYEAAKKLRKENITNLEFSNILFENLLYLYHESK